MFIYRQEHMQDIFYLDQISMKHSNPTLLKYTGRQKDILGISPKGYYLENRNYANSRVAPQRLESDSAYINQTNYTQVASKYKPKPLKNYIWAEDIIYE